MYDAGASALLGGSEYPLPGTTSTLRTVPSVASGSGIKGSGIGEPKIVPAVMSYANG